MDFSAKATTKDAACFRRRRPCSSPRSSSTLRVSCKGKSAQPVQVRPKEVLVHLGSYPGDGRATTPSKLRGQRPAFQGGSASVRAATRVKPEQASKGVTRAPSLLTEDEGRRGRPDAPTYDGRPARRGMGRSTYVHAMTCNTRDLFGRPGQLGNVSLGGGSDRSRRGPYDR